MHMERKKLDGNYFERAIGIGGRYDLAWFGLIRGEITLYSKPKGQAMRVKREFAKPGNSMIITR